MELVVKDVYAFKEQVKKLEAENEKMGASNEALRKELEEARVELELLKKDKSLLEASKVQIDQEVRELRFNYDQKAAELRTMTQKWTDLKALEKNNKKTNRKLQLLEAKNEE